MTAIPKHIMRAAICGVLARELDLDTTSWQMISDVSDSIMQLFDEVEFEYIQVSIQEISHATTQEVV